MKREDKIKKRKERARMHAIKRWSIYLAKIKIARDKGCPLSAIRKDGTTTSWRDPNSPTGYSQICSYDVYGTCQSPCNGDC